MDDKHLKNNSFYGTSTLGEKGQIVIPVEARKAMKIKKGEKLLVFGMPNELVVLCRLANVEKLVSHMTSKLSSLQEIIKGTKKR